MGGHLLLHLDIKFCHSLPARYVQKIQSIIFMHLSTPVCNLYTFNSNPVSEMP